MDPFGLRRLKTVPFVLLAPLRGTASLVHPSPAPAENAAIPHSHSKSATVPNRGQARIPPWPFLFHLLDFPTNPQRASSRTPSGQVALHEGCAPLRGHDAWAVLGKSARFSDATPDAFGMGACGGCLGRAEGPGRNGVK